VSQSCNFCVVSYARAFLLSAVPRWTSQGLLLTIAYIHIPVHFSARDEGLPRRPSPHPFSSVQDVPHSGVTSTRTALFHCAASGNGRTDSLISLTKTYARQRTMTLIIKDLISNPEVEFHVSSLATFN
jgi:hypothetical protein